MDPADKAVSASAENPVTKGFLIHLSLSRSTSRLLTSIIDRRASACKLANKFTKSVDFTSLQGFQVPLVYAPDSVFVFSILGTPLIEPGHLPFFSETDTLINRNQKFV